MQTIRLYFDNSYLKEFSANIIKVDKYDDNYSVILDKTAFYPESGGQPADKGLINGMPVIDVIDNKGIIMHIIEASAYEASPILHGSVNCTIDWMRRFEHMQQHTGQHILSACFYKLYGGNTSSFNIGKESSTIEIDMPYFDESYAVEIENMCNMIIYSNLAVKANVFDQAALQSMSLRKLPKVNTDIRIVDIDNTDLSPCGGTHVNFTGEIGMIKLKRWEKLKASYKFDFVCGIRALIDYRLKNSIINNLGSLLSSRDFEVEQYVNKLITDYKTLQKNYGVARTDLLTYEAEKLIGTAINIKNTNILSYTFKDRDINELKVLAQNITNKNSTVVLFTVENQNTQVLFSCSHDVNVNMGTLLKSVIQIINGKGGGNNNLAQGGGSNAEAVDQLINAAKHLLIEQL